ncbi:hypothetical protein [Sinosporangium album]|uniref:hypothetical protein n=1 Tax=Sinosporangium album TaxID=504805 RepID=UPI0015A33182|nr:hypothetical protein [Sinosporangium album]
MNRPTLVRHPAVVRAAVARAAVRVLEAPPAAFRRLDPVPPSRAALSRREGRRNVRL